MFEHITTDILLQVRYYSAIDLQSQTVLVWRLCSFTCTCFYIL